MGIQHTQDRLLDLQTYNKDNHRRIKILYKDIFDQNPYEALNAKSKTNHREVEENQSFPFSPLQTQQGAHQSRQNTLGKELMVSRKMLWP